MRERNWLSMLLVGGLTAIVILAPTQIGIEIVKAPSGGYALSLGTGEHSHVTVAHLSLVDPVVWLTFALWLVVRFRTGGWRTPLPSLVMPGLFVILSAVSLAKVPGVLGSAHKILQQVEYFIAAFLLFVTAFADRARLRQGVDAFLAVSSVVVLIGFVQYAIPSVDPLHVRGTFENRNVYGGFLSLALPLMFGLFLTDASLLRRAWLLVVLLAGLVSVTAGGAFLALAFALGCVAMGRGWRVFLGYAVALGLIVFVALPHLPRRNLEAHKAAVEFFNDDGVANRRYLEWQAAANMTAEHPLAGVGLGRYRANIGQYYGVNAPVGGTAAESYSQNTFLVVAAETGVPGLIAFLGLLLAAGAAAARQAAKAPDAAGKGLYLGIAGSVAAFSMAGLWSWLLVRGIGIPLVFILALAMAESRFQNAKPNPAP